ncbi:maleylpyruvate isomerase family mycothiol-dependent enzyme [Actinoplanes sp. LDG1-01]|uniref:Maleylpyruvate isomerase family mycothiol-dependent enzyme n=2 Tax=Paractinoplanes lichenicola TaxID=2802976 RepID=A0ABS1VQA9_9ACTN|nr:maleylpyruvate isomerase family mycothiol-dependent enzyme [Actinoplanes lichenicola]
MSRTDKWAPLRAEYAALADDLAGLDEGQWAKRSLCGEWSVEEVTAHLTAASSLSMPRWLGSMIGARFDADEHNRRRVAEFRGATPAETLARFRAAGARAKGPSGHVDAWLGEVVAHGQDIRRPLGLTRTPAVEVVERVARFYASRDFAVNSKTAATGLRLEATDGPFTAGDGPLVTGTTLALTMAMAGRAPYADDLTGPGAETLRSRIA